MKLLLKILFFLCIPIGAIAQQDIWAENYNAKQADSLRAAFQRTTNDTMRMRLSRSIGVYYQEMNWDSSMYYSEIQLALAKKLNFKLWQADAFDIIGWLSSNQKNYPRSLQYFLEGFKILNDKDCEKNIWDLKLFATDGKPATARLHSLGMIYNDISQLYKATGNKDKELANLVTGLNIGKSIRSYDILAITQNNLAAMYFRLDKPDSALLYARESLVNMDKADYKNYQGDDLNVIGTVYLKKKDYKLAKQYFDESINAYRAQHILTAIPNTYLSLADIFRALGKPDSSIYYTKKALTDDRKLGLSTKTNAVYSSLYDLYNSTGNADSAYFYLRLYKALNDSLTKTEKEKIDAYQNIGFNEQIKNQEELNKRDRHENEIRTYILIAGIIICLIIAFLLYRNSRNRRKANFLLSEQKEEIATQRDNLEEKNRELEIETALERVRTVAMGMMKPDDLLEICETMFHELKKLGFADLRNAMINVHYDDKKHLLNYDYSGSSGKTITNFAYNSHPIVDNIINHARQSSEGFTEMIYSGKALHEWRIFRKNNGEPDDEQFDNIDALYYYFYSIGNGAIGISNFSGVDHEQLNILKKFRNVFDLAYKRYVDIATAEAQVWEAQIELALERVRARTMAMQHSSELKDAASILFQQVELLGVNTWTSGFQLWDEDRKSVTVWTCTAGVVQQAFRLPVAGDDFFMMHVIEAEKNGEALYVEELVGKTLEDHYSYMAALPGLADNFKSLSDAGIALPASQVNHAAFFTYGYLLFITYQPMPQAHDIFRRFAKVFDQTYTRFLDLQKSEALALRAKEDLVLLQTEKKRAEDALTELQATQKQLIQSEKMASLGELTAGIAHEIQNPLNFVNNFSEVNHEMIDELEEELKAGNIEEALAIAADIKQNEEKISHHGKRADGIVKGMLQHSRTGGGEKQLTNMNVLADEFLRLSYHGLRAKDKSFNAELTTHFDPNLPKVSVLPQDMGRVLLNLFNNAFYAVNQKKKTAAPDYKPEVSVFTSSENGQVIIKVKDNGVGMPDAIKEKIMQPFFTTKPTGEGTGLGLSLTYDMVVKGHGGSIQVESTEGQGSEFIIILHN